MTATALREAVALAARRHGAGVLVLAALAVLYTWLNAFDELGSLHGDGLIYFLTAMQYAPYWPHDDLAEAVAATSQFPPVYSFALMLLGGGASFLAAHLATTLFLLAAFVAFYAWLQSLGLTPPYAAAGVAAFAIMPGTFLQSLYLHPEGLYLAFVFLALAWLERAECSGDSRWLWAASGAVAVAILTRTAGVTLLPGLAIALLRRRPANALAILALPIVPAALWSLIHHPTMSYSEALLATYAHGTALQGLLDSVSRLVINIGYGLAWNTFQNEAIETVGIAIGIVALAIAAWRFVLGKADAWYLAAYLAVLAIWPYPQEAWRLTWVVVPVVLAHLCWLAEVAHARWAHLDRRLLAVVRGFPIAASVLVAIPTFALNLDRATAPLALRQPALRLMPEWYQPDPRMAYRLAASALAVVDALREFAPRIPEGQCIYSPAPLLTAYFTDRNTRLTPRDYADDRTFNEKLRAEGCRYVLMFAIPTLFPRDFYPRERLGARLTVIAEHRPPGSAAPVALLGVLDLPAPGSGRPGP